MRKLLVIGALALAVAVLSARQAAAWRHWKLGGGVTLDLQPGGHNWLWGAFKNGQAPGYPDCINGAPNCPGCYYKNYLHYGLPPGLNGGPGHGDPGFGGHGGPGFGAAGFGHDGSMIGAPGVAPT